MKFAATFSIVIFLLFISCENKTLKQEISFKLVSIHVTDNKSTESDQVFKSAIFYFTNENNFSIQIPQKYFELQMEDVIIENVSAVEKSNVSVSTAINLDSEGNINIPAKFSFYSVVELSSFENMDYYPPGYYRVKLKISPDCFAYIKKNKYGLIENM